MVGLWEQREEAKNKARDAMEYAWHGLNRAFLGPHQTLSTVNQRESRERIRIMNRVIHRVFHCSCAALTFFLAVSSVNGGLRSAIIISQSGRDVCRRGQGLLDEVWLN